jgi:hypothetical protein
MTFPLFSVLTYLRRKKGLLLASSLYPFGSRGFKGNPVAKRSKPTQGENKGKQEQVQGRQQKYQQRSLSKPGQKQSNLEPLSWVQKEMHPDQPVGIFFRFSVQKLLS